MDKTYTLSEVVELKNKRQQLEQRIAVHKQRAIEKQTEINEILTQAGVQNIEELSALCAKTNAEMQEFAKQQETVIAQMKEYCDELDRML